MHARDQLFGLQIPIVQAPMAGVSTPALAAAVSNAGALGSLGIGASTVRDAGLMIDETLALTPQAFNVNVFCHQPAKRDPDVEAAWTQHLVAIFAELEAEPPDELNEIYSSFLQDDTCLRMLLDKRPAVVSFHFGLPPNDWIGGLRRAGVRTMATATSLAEAGAIERAGVDVIVAQGIEAGGHRGMFDPDAADEGLTTMTLVQLLVRECRIPVVAAGGIMTGAAVRGVLDMGAAAAQMGTAFLLCPESAASTSFREHLSTERAGTTRLTSVISGRPARGIVNRLIELGEAASAPKVPSYPVAYDVAKRLNAAAIARGVFEFAAEWAGQGAPLARPLPAGELIGVLSEELTRSR